MKLFPKYILSMTAILLSLCSLPAFSSPIGYTNYNDFMNALPGEASVLNFDNMYGNVVESGDTIDGITFNYSPYYKDKLLAGSLHFMTPTTSGFGSLGSTSMYNDEMLAHGFSLAFEPVNAIGMYFIVDSMSYVDLFSLDIRVGNFAVNADYFGATDLSWGYTAYFLGIIDDQNTFTQADIAPFTTPTMFYKVDDIITAAAPSPIPVPSSIFLIGAGLLSLAGIGRKRLK